MTDTSWLWLTLTAFCGLFLFLSGCGGVEPEPAGAGTPTGCVEPEVPGVALTCSEYRGWLEGETSGADLIRVMAGRCSDAP